MREMCVGAEVYSPTLICKYVVTKIDHKGTLTLLRKDSTVYHTNIDEVYTTGRWLDIQGLLERLDD